MQPQLRREESCLQSKAVDYGLLEAQKVQKQLQIQGLIRQNVHEMSSNVALQLTGLSEEQAEKLWALPPKKLVRRPDPGEVEVYTRSLQAPDEDAARWLPDLACVGNPLAAPAALAMFAYGVYSAECAVVSLAAPSRHHGRPPCQAPSMRAGTGFTDYVCMNLHRFDDGKDVGQALFNGFAAAHASINIIVDDKNDICPKDGGADVGEDVQSKETCLVGGVLLKLKRELMGFSHDEPYGFFFATMGDCKVLRFCSGSGAVIDLNVNVASESVGKQSCNFLSMDERYEQVTENDVIIMMTGATWDAFNPMNLGLTPRDCGVKAKTWESMPMGKRQQAISTYICRALTKSLESLCFFTPTILTKMIMSQCRQIYEQCPDLFAMCGVNILRVMPASEFLEHQEDDFTHPEEAEPLSPQQQYQELLKDLEQVRAEMENPRTTARRRKQLRRERDALKKDIHRMQKTISQLVLSKVDSEKTLDGQVKGLALIVQGGRLPSSQSYASVNDVLTRGKGSPNSSSGQESEFCVAQCNSAGDITHTLSLTTAFNQLNTQPGQRSSEPVMLNSARGAQGPGLKSWMAVSPNEKPVRPSERLGRGGGDAEGDETAGQRVAGSRLGSARSEGGGHPQQRMARR